MHFLSPNLTSNATRFAATCTLLASLGSAPLWAQTGSWDGTWLGSYSSGGNSSLSATIRQAGDRLSGTVSIRNTDCGTFFDLPLGGRVSGRVAEFDISARCPQDGSSNRVEFTRGSLAGNDASGQFTVLRNNSFYDRGTWQLRRTRNRFEVRTGSNGSLSPANGTTAAAGSDLTFTISPATGYVVADVVVDGASVGAVSTHTFSAIDANHTISASFRQQQAPPPPTPPSVPVNVIIDQLLDD